MQELFETGELTDLVGINPIYLNKFIERERYGIKPSIRIGKKRERRRLFSTEDVFGVALVWWLFEAGLRSQVIQFVLDQICKVRKAPANLAAKKLLEHKIQVLVVRRERRTGEDAEAEYPEQKVALVTGSRTARLLDADSTTSILFVPVGNLFSALMEEIEALESSEQGD